MALFGHGDTDVAAEGPWHQHQSRDHLRVARHKHKKHKKKHRHRCRPESVAQICAGRCGTVTNRCGASIDCGACSCGGCQICQTCHPDRGQCVPNASVVGQVCGASKICQADGRCTCEEGTCPTGQRCNGLDCVCDTSS